MKQGLGIWPTLERWASVSFLYLVDSSNPTTFPPNRLPGGEVRPLKQGVLEDAFNITDRGDGIDSTVIGLPELAVWVLRGPPAGVVLE